VCPLRSGVARYRPGRCRFDGIKARLRLPGFRRSQIPGLQNTVTRIIQCGVPNGAAMEGDREHLDMPASNTLTCEILGWQPTHPGLLADLDNAHYLDK
jgi:hypothetical protein